MSKTIALQVLSKPLKSVAAAAAMAVGALAVPTAALADPSKFRVERVTFTSGGETIVGNLYVPLGASANSRAAAAVVTGAWMSIKEQMAGRYAQELAERGVVALAFDFRNWGESGGRERALESPEKKTQDIQAAVSFLQSRAEVDQTRLGGVGVCASAAYMAAAAASTPALTRVAFVAPWLHDRAIVDQVYGGRAVVDTLIAASRTAEQKFRQSGELTLVPAASSTDRNAVMFGVPYYTEPQRGMIPQWENRFNVASWEGWLTLDAMPQAPRLTQPTLMVHSEAAAIPQGARQFYSQIRSPKVERWLPGVSQFDFYDQAGAVKAAADAVAQHLSAEHTALIVQSVAQAQQAVAQAVRSAPTLSVRAAAAAVTMTQ